jgi:hypothetical protein
MIVRARALALFARGVRTQARYDYAFRASPEAVGGWPEPMPSLATPRQAREPFLEPRWAVEARDIPAGALPG